MGTKSTEATGRDLTQGVAVEDIREGEILEGHIGDETVILVRSGKEVFAVSGTCSHYSGPLAKGIVDGDTVHCPWHHACFSLRTGEALRAPAFNPVDCWTTEMRNARIFVTGKIKRASSALPSIQNGGNEPNSIVIIGGGAAGFAAAEMLRRRNFAGKLTMLSADADPPYDRPNLSKDYLAGTAPEDWIPLRSPKFYERKQIDLHLATPVSRIDSQARVVLTADQRSFPFDRLLLALGAEPVKLAIPGADQHNVFTLRSLADSRALVERAKATKAAVVIGAGFIGLEVAASLRAREIGVHVVAPDRQPLERVLGAELGGYIRSLHEEHGVKFRLQDTVSNIDGQRVTLKSGEVLAADLVIVGIGVKPHKTLAAEAGIATGDGILVDEYLKTSVPEIFAAGDAAEWPDRMSGKRVRIEHWVVAERQGQVAACNMLGEHQAFSDAPFFWSAHYDMAIRYVGHARHWDAAEIDGDLKAGKAVVRYRSEGRTLAVATVGQDREALRAAVSFEHESAHAQDS
jgi:NADPH-dependent 2,4-dienoyl-CoA reductase/sulfur reductase-like enzyme/nitrite reductase/ring-hydroxylating ferredoxin subunit